MSGVAVGNVYSLLMLFPFALVLGTALLFVALAAHWSRRRSAALASRIVDESLFAVSTKPVFSPSLFDQPVRWLAVKSNNPSTVQSALGLQAAVPCSWEEGLHEARDQKMFVSPPINGWVVVVGSALPDPADDVDGCFHFLRELSHEVGQVQFFTVNRVLNYHGWALVDRGNVFRAYAWAGETLWNQGPLTAAERELQLRCFDYATDRNVFAQREPLIANTEKVPRLASRWSVDPMGLRDGSSSTRQGVVGSFSHWKLH